MKISVYQMYFPSVEQSNAINAASDPDVKQKDMAGFYADAIRADTIARFQGMAGVDWKTVNEAITNRWPKGLLRIKTAAWRELEKKP